MRNLTMLWDTGELTNAINRVVQQENHLFVRNGINGVFKSRGLGSARQIPGNRMGDASPLDAPAMDVERPTSALMRALDARTPQALSIEVSTATCAEIHSWLHVIEVFSSYEVRSLEPGPVPYQVEIVTQPGLRYSQALELMEVLRNDAIFPSLSEDERTLVFDTINQGVLGRMLEEIVIHETDAARGGCYRRLPAESARPQSCQALQLRLLEGCADLQDDSEYQLSRLD